jgi:superfamily I DNA/RNA helicase
MEKQIQFSEQQQDFINWAINGEGSCVLIAVAGSGKSTTVVEAAIQMPGQIALMAYNKSAGNELKEKLLARGIDWKKCQAGTAHSFGLSAYRRAYPKLIVDNDKVYKIINPYAEENEVIAKHEGKIKFLISQAKQRALGVIGNIADNKQWFDIIDRFDVIDEENGVDPIWLIDQARRFLTISNKHTATIDFDDMIYLPLLFNLSFYKFDGVVMDEGQDSNAARRALIRAMLKPGGRAMIVGDRHQAIYGFTGADNDSLDIMKADFAAKEMPLTVSYRCPKAVVAYSQAWVSHIQAHPDAPTGTVTTLLENEFYARPDLDHTSAVLCRLTKPLVALAFSLIRKKVPCKVEGRDIGQGIKKLALRWKVTTTDELESKLNDYLERETTNLLAKKQETKLAQVEDMVETIMVIIEQCRLEKKVEVDDVVKYIDTLFADDVNGMLTLSTIHKSKGREWEHVFWLNRASTCPSPWARQQWQKEQENNLCYVAATRAKSHLIELTIVQEKKPNQKGK